jgi:hypothetical protein
MKDSDKLFNYYGMPTGATLDLTGLSSLTGLMFDELDRTYRTAYSAAAALGPQPKLDLESGKWKATSTTGHMTRHRAAMKAVYKYICSKKQINDNPPSSSVQEIRGSQG